MIVVQVQRMKKTHLIFFFGLSGMQITDEPL